MSAQTWTVFDAKTRLPVSCVTCNRQALADHVKDGQIAIDGRHRGAVRLNDANEVEPDPQRAKADASENARSARLARIEQLEEYRGAA